MSQALKSISSRKSLVVLLLCSWAFFVVLLVPAKWAGSLLQDRLPYLTLQGVSGTVWSGNADSGYLAVGQYAYPLGSMQWRWKAMSLLSFQLCFQVTLNENNASDSQPLRGHGDVCHSLWSRWSLQNVSLYSDAGWLPPDYPKLSGPMSLYLQHMQWSASGLNRLEGELQWQRAQWYDGQHWHLLGHYQVGLSDDGQGGGHGHISSVNDQPVSANKDEFGLSRLQLDLQWQAQPAVWMGRAGPLLKGELWFSDKGASDSISQALLALGAESLSSDRFRLETQL